jgi:hypothetical protein
MVESDVHLDPQALILAPANVIEISKEIVSAGSQVEAAKLGALKSLEIIKNAIENGSVLSNKRENEWIKKLEDEISSIPSEENKFIEEMLPQLEGRFLAREYGL